MEVAERLKMPLSECLKRVSYREYLLWLERFEHEWNVPTKLEHYLMQIAVEVRRVLSKRPGQIKLEHFKLQFGKKGEQPAMTEADRERVVALSKAKWTALVGGIKRAVQRKPSPDKPTP